MPEHDHIDDDNVTTDDALPDGWVWTTIKDILDVNYGKGLTKTNRIETGTIPVYGSSGVTGWHSDALSYGPTVVIGRKGAAGAVHLSKSDCWVIDTAYFLQPPSELVIEYVYYVLSFLDLVSLDKSTAIPSLSRDDLYAQIIPIPPYNEQRRIVEAIESLFTQLDAGVAALKRLRANLRRYKAAVLKAACEGRLVPQDPNDEPASDLLRRILAERRAKWAADLRARGKDPRKVKYDEPAAPDTSDLPELPEGWVWASVEQLSGQITSGSRGWADYYSENGSLFIRVGNFNRLSTQLDLENIVFVKPPQGAEADRTRLRINDLLVTITADVGMVGVVDEKALQWGEAYINQHVGLVRLVNEALSRFTAFAIASETVQSQIRSKQYGATKAGLGFAELKSLPIPVSSLDEQNRIVESIEQQFSVIDELESIIKTNLQRAERLRQSILKRAFEGQLVPQDPNDEPASELLKRIRKTRSSNNRKTRS